MEDQRDYAEEAWQRADRERENREEMETETETEYEPIVTQCWLCGHEIA